MFLHYSWYPIKCYCVIIKNNITYCTLFGNVVIVGDINNVFVNTAVINVNISFVTNVGNIDVINVCANTGILFDIVYLKYLLLN